MPKLISGLLRQVQRGTCALAWLAGQLSDGSGVGEVCPNERHKVTPGAQLWHWMVERTQNSVTRRGGRSR